MENVFKKSYIISAVLPWLKVHHYYILFHFVSRFIFISKCYALSIMRGFTQQQRQQNERRDVDER